MAIVALFSMALTLSRSDSLTSGQASAGVPVVQAPAAAANNTQAAPRSDLHRYRRSYTSMLYQEMYEQGCCSRFLHYYHYNSSDPDMLP